MVDVRYILLLVVLVIFALIAYLYPPLAVPLGLGVAAVAAAYVILFG